MFKRWVGISPKRFSQYLSKEYIKTLLDEGIKPLDASYQAGLSGPARLHDLFIQTEAVSPAQYRAKGQGLRIHYGFHESPFGDYLLAVTDKGICHLEFTTPVDSKAYPDYGNNGPFRTPLEMKPRQNLYTSVCLAICLKNPGKSLFY